MLESVRLLVSEHLKAWVVWGGLLVLDLAEVYERFAPDRMREFIGNPSPFLLAGALFFLLVLPYHKLRLEKSELQAKWNESHGAPNRLAIRVMRERALDLRRRLLEHLGKSQPSRTWSEAEHQQWRADVTDWERECFDKLSEINPDWAVYFRRDDDDPILEGNAHDFERKLDARQMRLYDLAPTTNAMVLG